ncbi:hypothetical protein [Streptomyces sp. NPDC056061]|uniref:hypothetical protein n=1 Tax=Streptomyces sp. NPDC056061 TaxID=3345700 RepID=UPI0035E2E469
MRIDAAELNRLIDRLVPGSRLPLISRLAQDTGLDALDVRTGLAQLDSLGIVHYQPYSKAGSRALEHGEIHPDDTDAAHDITTRISTGTYKGGQALPDGLIALRHGLTTSQITRVLRALAHQGLVRYDRAGPHGPAFYVQPTPSDAADRTPNTPSHHQ